MSSTTQISSYEQARVLLTNEANADRIERSLVEHLLVLDDELVSRGSTSFNAVDTAADDAAQLYCSSGTTGLAKGILHAHRYLLAHEEFIYQREGGFDPDRQLAFLSRHERSRHSSATTCRPTPIRGRSSSCRTCQRR